MDCSTDISLFGFIGRTMRSVMILLEQNFKDEGIPLNLPQFILMNILSHNDDLILEDLAKFLNKDKSAILRNINHLENERFVAKMVDKADRRRKVLIPTQKGVEILEKARKIEGYLVKILTIGTSNSDIANFKNVLEIIKSNTKEILIDNFNKIDK